MNKIERLKTLLNTHWSGDKESLARSLCVTTRAVYMWFKGDRAVNLTALKLAELLSKYNKK